MFLLRLIPAMQGNGRRCEQQVGLTAAGKYVCCNSRSYVHVDPPDGLVMCKRHFDESKARLERVCLKEAWEQELEQAKH